MGGLNDAPLSGSNVPTIADSLLRTQRRGVILFALVMLAFVPRAIVAWQMGGVCDDAHYYIFTAAALEAGRMESALYYLNLNVYPAILLGLHKLGFEWDTAGKLWGLLLGTLTVLPLYGWVRRIFDERIAIAACFLYSIDPSLIEISPEPLRETTFWFFLTLCLYFTWRAVDEARLRWFALGGAVMALAVHTRGEGWLLIVPLALWSILRWRSNPAQRWRLAMGGFAWLAATPCLLVLVNVTLLASHPKWELGRLDQFSWVVTWLQPEEKTEPAVASEPAPVEAPPQVTEIAMNVDEPVTAPVPMSTAKALLASRPEAEPLTKNEVSFRAYIKELVEGMWPIHLGALVLGLVLARRRLLDREKLALTLMAAAILAAIWIRLVAVGSMQSRYFLTLSFLLAPYMGIALVTCEIWMRQLAPKSFKPRQIEINMAVTTCVLIAVAWADAVTNDYDRRAGHIAYGQWLEEHLGPQHYALSDFRSLRVAYHSGEDTPAHLITNLTAQLNARVPDVVILSRRELPPPLIERMCDIASSFGMTPLIGAETHPAADEFVVLVPPGAQDALKRTVEAQRDGSVR